MALVVMAFLAAAPAGADSHFGHSRSGAGEPETVSDRGNPWAVEQPPENPLDFQRLPKYRSQQYRPEATDRYGRANHFVTPEILDSIKQQQTQNQLMYGNRYYPRQRVPAYTPLNPLTLPGAVYTDPLYDVPLVSPWGSQPDLLYQGSALPLVPNEALGGLPPIPLYDTTPGINSNFFDPFGFSQGMYGY